MSPRNHQPLRIPNWQNLPTISDDEIYRILGALKGKMRHAAGNKDRIKTLQEEFCYVQRELGIRQARRKAHQEWLAKQGNNRSRRHSA